METFKLKDSSKLSQSTLDMFKTYPNSNGEDKGRIEYINYTAVIINVIRAVDTIFNFVIH